MRFFLLLIGSFLFLNTASRGQSDKIDSLSRVLSSLKDTARVECITAIWIHYMIKRDEDSALYYTKLGYEESKKINYIHGIASFYVQRAFMAKVFHGDFSLTEQMAQESIKWFEKTPNKKGIGYTYGMLCSSISGESNTDEALSKLTGYYEHAQRTHDELLAHSCLEAMTEIYRDRGDYDKLLDTQEKLVGPERSSDETKEYTTHQLWVIGLMYMVLDEYSTALPYWRELFFVNEAGDFTNLDNEMGYAELLTHANQTDSALSYYNKFDSANRSKPEIALYMVSKGEYFLFLQEYTTALPYFLNALLYFQQFHDYVRTKRDLLDLARTYLALRVCDSAISFARQGLAIALQAKSKPSIRDAYEILSSAYDELTMPDSANQYFKKYITTKDSVLSEQTRGRFATYSYQQKIAALNAAKATQQQQLKQEKDRRNILLGTLLLGLLLAAFLIRSIQLKRRKDQLQHLMTEANTQLESKRKEQQLAEMQKQKTELEMQALRAQMNPHFIFNSLNSINMFILENNKLRASEYLSKFSRLVRLILQNSQEEFIPLEKELESLQLYLELESLRFENKLEYKITVAKNVDITVLKVPPLIIQPHAENAIWHGLMHKKEKGNLEVELHVEKETLFCRIFDDGIGRRKASELRNKSGLRHKSMGIKITEDRISMMKTNGTTKSVETKDLVNADGTAAGTEVVLNIPVRIN